MIEQWKIIYEKYLYYNEVSPDLYDEIWIDKCNNMMNYWEKMEKGEVPRFYDSFYHYLSVEMALYKRLNDDYYVRFGRQVIEIPNHGKRYIK